MRVFNKDGKVNFVDVTNVFVGYDMRQDCCEYADWFIDVKINYRIPENDSDMESHIDDHNLELVNKTFKDFVFDTGFFNGYEDEENETYIVIFKMHHKVKLEEIIYLHLFNCHNGYYKHGFEFKDDDCIIRDGAL